MWSWVFFVGSLFCLITESVSFFFCLGLGSLCVSRNLLISSRLSNLLAYDCSECSLTSPFISVKLVVLLFLILSNLRLLSFLVSLAKGMCKFCWSFQRSNFWFHWSEFVFEEKFCFSASSFGAFILVSVSTEVLFSSGCSVFKMMALFSFDEWSYISIDLNRKSSPFSKIGLATFWQVQQAWDGNKGKSPLRMLKSVTVIVGLIVFAKSKFNQTQISKCKHFLYLLPYSQMPSHHLSSTDRGHVFTSFFLIRLISSHPISPQKSHLEVKLEKKSCQLTMKPISFLHLTYIVCLLFFHGLPSHLGTSSPSSNISQNKEDPLTCFHQENHVKGHQVGGPWSAN